MRNANPEVAYVSSAVGGSLSRLSFEGSEARSRVAAIYGGGIRGSIEGYSRASRRGLLRRLASINRTVFRAYDGRIVSVTLTYPSEYPEDAEACKKHLKALRKRLTRKHG
jgi:DNA-binding PucR family transcriptional regulator